MFRPTLFKRPDLLCWAGRFILFLLSCEVQVFYFVLSGQTWFKKSMRRSLFGSEPDSFLKIIANIWLYECAALRWLLGGIFVKPLMAGIICVNGLFKFYHLSIMLNRMGMYEREISRFGSCNVHIIWIKTASAYIFIQLDGYSKDWPCSSPYCQWSKQSFVWLLNR